VGDDVVGLVGEDLGEVADFLVATLAAGVGNDEGHLGVEFGEEILKVFGFEEVAPVAGPPGMNVENHGAVAIDGPDELRDFELILKIPEFSREGVGHVHLVRGDEEMFDLMGLEMMGEGSRKGGLAGALQIIDDDD